MMKYQILDQLQQHKAQLLDSVELGSGMQLAMWQNNQDREQRGRGLVQLYRAG
jgi:AraC family transcriptional regulator